MSGEESAMNEQLRCFFFSFPSAERLPLRAVRAVSFAFAGELIGVHGFCYVDAAMGCSTRT